MKFLITSSYGSENPTRTTLAWLQAKGAVEAGHEATISLLGDSVVVLREEVAEHIQGMGLPPIKDLIQFARDNKITVFA